MKRKQMMALVVLVIVLGMAFTSLLIQGASAINMTVSGDVVSNEYRADFDGQTFLGDEILTSEFYYNWTSGEGFIKIYTLKGLVTISMEDAEYDPLSYKFTIKKFKCTYPTGYPYKITLSQIWGDQTSSTFTGYMVGSYTETGSSEEEECDGCWDIEEINDYSTGTATIKVTTTVSTNAIGMTVITAGQATQTTNMIKTSDKNFLGYINYTQGQTVSYFLAFDFKDVSDVTTGFRTLYTNTTGTSSGWVSTGTGSTTNDYSTALAKAKANGFTTVTAYIADMNTSLTSKNSQITTMKTTLATRNKEVEDLKTENSNYKNNYILKSTYDNLLSNYNKLQSDYSALQGKGTTVTPSEPINIDLKTVGYGLGGLVVLVGAVIGYRKLKGRKGKKKLPRIPTEMKEKGLPTEEDFNEDGDYNVNETIKNIEFHYAKEYPKGSNVKPKERKWNRL